ncbi:acyl-CoA dehydrogenase [Mycolicibacterium anyangense]|uniref:Acyl-CoA dehydrogenase n=1 Tax=Mycolicibacterium anyangense TaxID=1431246 RepID=A0A6N4WF38_9MYCO|nr:acyl-CoA dehydrogenase [Mycolicibacterium anyangense]BBZ78787.1 acyl-CoA dehydrogenase [Mycolicibacterium anyangense]
MPNDILSRRDIDFLLYDWLGVEDLTQRARYSDHSRETFDGVLDLCEQLAEKYFAPHNKLNDTREPTFDGSRVHVNPEVKRAFEAFAAADLIGMSMDYELGGAQLPVTVANAGFAWFHAANVSTAAYLMLTMANANLLATYGSTRDHELFVKPMLAGRFSGTMCLSEPQAGSSLADITTRAELTDGGHYRLFGSKMWISGGEHEITENIVHLVLARIAGAPAGVKGLSLFVVPKFLVDDDAAIGERNDVALGGLNHKMGYRGTTNTVLNFGDGTHRPYGSAGAVGYLVGQPNAGISYMFHMMNEARLGVGIGAVALGYTGYLKSVRYASERLQGRAAARKGVDDKPVPIIEHADVRRMLLTQKSYVEGALALALYCANLVDVRSSGADKKESAEATLLLDVLTPIAKSWPSQWCLAANDLAIQVHGGYGYTRDYDVEQHYRDNRLNPIHEGTHGIQSLDLLGRKVTQHDGASLALLSDRIAKTIDTATARGEELAHIAGQLGGRWTRLIEVTAKLVGEADRELALANSAIYLEAFGHLVIAWIWLELLLVSSSRDTDFYAGKVQAGRFFYRYELPRVDPQLELLESLDSTTVDMKAEWFS